MLMKKIIFLFAVVIVITEIGCISKRKKFDGLWFYSHSSGTNENNEIETTPASFMDLEPDGSYTRDFGGFDQGHWKQKESTLYLISKTGNMVSFPIKYFVGNELQLVSGKETILNFERQPSKFSSPSDNPYSATNNQWRVKAVKKENDQEIKNRLRNHCRFYELYFKWALDNKFSSIDVRSTPSLIKIYGNGLALKTFDELPAKWQSYFYDAEDCNKANELMKNIFEHGDIAWAHTDSKYKMFISAFQQLQQQLQ